MKYVISMNIVRDSNDWFDRNFLIELSGASDNLEISFFIFGWLKSSLRFDIGTGFPGSCCLQ